MQFRLLLIVGVLAIALMSPSAWWPAAAETTNLAQAQANLRINEFMASNSTTLEDPDQPGAFPDWIELYNPGPNPVRLDGLFLSDNPNRPTKFAIADGVTIPARGFLVFYADNDPEQGPLHTNFALNRQSGYIGLFHGESDTVIDSYSYGFQETDISEGRQVDGGLPWRFFDTPTPGATNTILPPSISNVLQTPTQPLAGEAVTVTAIIDDDRGLSSAILTYNLPGASPVTVPMSATSELESGYLAVIPPFPDGALVSYFLVATDEDGLTARSPRLESQRPYRYLVGLQTPTLYINEVMAHNTGVLKNPRLPDDFPDWVEIYNPGDEDVSLDGLFLTDNPDAPTKYPIPSGLTVPAGGFVLFYADNNNDSQQWPVWPHHTNFALARDGEYVGLYAHAELAPIDEIEFGYQSTNGVMARYPDGTGPWVHTGCYSPGEPNEPCAVRAHLPLASSP